MINTRTLAACFGVALISLFSGVASAQAPGESKTAQNWRSLLIEEAKAIQLNKAITEERLAEMEMRLRKNHVEVEAVDVSEIAFEDVFRMLHMQNAELSIDLGGLNARLTLLKEQVQKKKEDELTLASVEIEAGKKQLELTEQRLETTERLHAKGARSDIELSQARHEAEIAKLQLRRAKIMQQQAPSPIVDAVFETALEIAEKKARLEAVTKMLDSHRSAREAVSNVSQLKEEMNLERATLRKLKTELQNVELQLKRGEDSQKKF